MSPGSQDPWETETLTPINDAEITILDAFFEDGKFGVQLTQVMRVDIPHDPVEIPFETFNNWLSVGKGWVIQEQGASIVKPTSDPTKPSKIHASSNYGKFMNRVGEIGLDMRGRGLPTQASVWKDLRFHMQREKVKYTGLPTAEGGTQDVEASILLPISHLPATGAATAAPPSPVAGAAPPPEPSAPAASPMSTTSGPSVAVPADGTAEAHLISVILGKNSMSEAKGAAVRDQRIAADDALSSRILEHQLIESFFGGDKPVLVMTDGRIARASS